jgi:hypothetical protein
VAGGGRDVKTALYKTGNDLLLSSVREERAWQNGFAIAPEGMAMEQIGLLQRFSKQPDY